MPNNFFFFTRAHVEQFKPQSLTWVLHSRYELVVCYKGRAKAVIDDEVFNIEPGTAHWVRPGEFHIYFDFQPGPIHWLFFSFDLDAKSQLLPRAKAMSRVTPEDFALLDEAGELYVEQVQDGIEIYPVAQKMAEIITRLADDCQTIAPIAKLDDSDAYTSLTLIRKIAFFTTERMAQGVQIDDLTRYLNLSEGYLRKVFREQVGISLGTWVRNSRFSRGVQLLLDETLAISDIAKLTGFETIHSFSQAFSKRVGMPPTAYRKHLAEGGQPFRLPDKT